MSEPATDRSEEIRARALARARTERGTRPRVPVEDFVDYARALGESNAATRAANREQDAARETRWANNLRRIAAARSLRWITDGFAEYVDAQATDPQVTAWLDATLAGGRSWLVLLGPVGTGKTWQAVGAYRALVEYLGGTAVAVRAPDALARSMPSDPDRINVRTLEDADLLLLDDVPASLSEWEHKVLFRIIDARAANGRRTIVTTNLLREEVRPKLGDRIASRLSANTRAILLSGADRRLTH
jgi:chromosomal replication initiation ATPase DnaA